MMKSENLPPSRERESLLQRGLRLFSAWEQWLLIALLLAMGLMVASLLWPKPQTVITLKPYAASDINITEEPLPALAVTSSDTAEISENPVPESTPTKKRKQSRSSAHAKKPKNPPVLNINRAASSQLQLLPGIGPKMAQRIIEFRKLNGGFKTVEQIMDVKGIGVKKYEKIKPYLRI